ncbi:uncharacterized protein LOC110270781 [Arachis ipaensis]|uniref:uncharacterized protein LOC110270781 n=1 Tax=Arachis ipaensis TaxID=130454 RepID=UPI000A2B3811|nr:uncharacterized protein LOC110270781 [Arachis ipaensis]
MSCHRIHPAFATSAEEEGFSPGKEGAVGAVQGRRKSRARGRGGGSLCRAATAPCRRWRSFVHRRRSLAPPKKPPRFVPPTTLSCVITAPGLAAVDLLVVHRRRLSTTKNRERAR